MDRSYYASIEVGRRNVSLSNLSKIANGFNISIAALISANAVSVSIDGVAGGKVTARDRAASSASEGDGIAVPISL